MKFISAIAGLFFFILFFGFALMNTQLAELHFFLNYELRGPLVLMLLGFFIAGASLGILALTPTVLRQRREANRQKATLLALQKGAGNASPQADVTLAPSLINKKQHGI